MNLAVLANKFKNGETLTKAELEYLWKNRTSAGLGFGLQRMLRSAAEQAGVNTSAE